MMDLYYIQPMPSPPTFLWFCWTNKISQGHKNVFSSGPQNLNLNNVLVYSFGLSKTVQYIDFLCTRYKKYLLYTRVQVQDVTSTAGCTP